MSGDQACPTCDLPELHIDEHRRVVKLVSLRGRALKMCSKVGYAAEMPTPEALLQEMLDEFALRKLVHAYCRAVDRGDFAKLRDLYHARRRSTPTASSRREVSTSSSRHAGRRPVHTSGRCSTTSPP